MHSMLLSPFVGNRRHFSSIFCGFLAISFLPELEKGLWKGQNLPV